MDEILTSMLSEALTNVNLVIVVVLMAIGFIIKHVKFLEKVENNLIPPILLVVSIVISFIDTGITLPSAFSAIISAAIAIGLHQSGKNIFTITIIPGLVKVLGLQKIEEGEVEEIEPEFEEENIEE